MIATKYGIGSYNKFVCNNFKTYFKDFLERIHWFEENEDYEVKDGNLFTRIIPLYCLRVNILMMWLCDSMMK